MNNSYENELDIANKNIEEAKYNEAFKHYKKVVEINPDVAEAYFGMAESARYIPKIKAIDILTYYEKAIEKDPKVPDYYINLGDFHLEMNNVKEAEMRYKQAAEIDEKNSFLYLSDLAVEYYINMTARLDDDSPQIELDEIRKNSLIYFIKSMGITVEEALKLLK